MASAHSTPMGLQTQQQQQNQFSRLGLTMEQVRVELYSAWRKDSREAATPESYKRYRALVDHGLREKEIVLRNADIGPNVALALASVLPKSSVSKLDLQSNLLQDAGAEAVAHMLREAPSLTHVNVGGNDIGSSGIQVLSAIISTHKKLQVLVLGSSAADTHVNRVDPASAKTLVQACIQCKTLKVLDLNRNPIGRGSQEAFSDIARLITSSTNLQVLRLGETEMAPESAMHIIEALRKSPSLSELHLHSNNLPPRAGDAIGALLEERGKRLAPSCLKTLVLHSNPTLGGAGTAAVFRGLTTDKGLATLSLFGCGVDDEATMVLCDALDSNGALTSLDLHANNITSVGAAEIARSLVGHPALQVLALSDNKIRDEGACAIAAMLETNKVLETVKLDGAWIGDRGAVALGVALAGNTTLHSLSMEGNHISEDGGSALAALLAKNKVLLDVNVKGNSIFHNTASQLKKIVDRNNETKQAEIPNKLKREVVRLHYQLYKLEEAKSELELHRNRKSDIERAQERFDAQFREEDAEYVKKKKDLEEGIRDQQQACTSLDSQLKTMRENFARFCVQHEAEVKILEDRLALDTADRQRAEEELARVQKEIALVETQRHQRVEQLQQQIDEAKADREKWIAQTKEARERAEIAMEKLKQLEAQLVAKEAATTSGGAAAAAPAAARRTAAAGRQAAGQDAIAALLGGAGGA